jgi:hypothetical protein
MSARSLPPASDTRLVPAEWALGWVGALELPLATGAAWLAQAAGRLVAATAAAPPTKDVLRKFLRDRWHSIVFLRSRLDFRLSIYSGANGSQGKNRR